MKPLIVLLAVFAIAVISIKVFQKKYDYALAGRIALSAMLVFTAMGHFVFANGMAMMIPDFIPMKKELVYLTGLIEIAAAIGLHFHKWRLLTAWLLIVFFILILPANVKAALEHIDYQKGSFNGPGPVYLWFRIPMQVILIIWVYLSAIRS